MIRDVKIFYLKVRRERRKGERIEESVGGREEENFIKIKKVLRCIVFYREVWVL